MTAVRMSAAMAAGRHRVRDDLRRRQPPWLSELGATMTLIAHIFDPFHAGHRRLTVTQRKPDRLGARQSKRGIGAMDFWTIVVICLICGGIAAAIGQAKKLPIGQSFALGALLGIIGLIIVICQKPGLPPAPPGMRAVKCRRCNTAQNIPEAQRVFECWQCKSTYELWGVPPESQTKAAVPTMPKPHAATTKNVRCNACQHVQAVPITQSTFPCEECGTRLKRKQVQD